MKKGGGYFMIEKIVLYNFKSYKDCTEIDFKRTNYASLMDNVSSTDVLKTMMFVGGNASGKSTIVEAIKYLLDALFEEKNITRKNYKCRFGDGESYKLVYYFMIDGHEICYSIKNNIVKRMLTEELSIDDNMYMNRKGTSATSYIIDRTGQDFDSTDVDEETLFLRTLYFNTKFTTNETLKKWMQYLLSSVYINLFDGIITSYGKKDYRITNYLTENGTDAINSFFEKYNFKQTIEYENYSAGKHGSISIINGEKEIFFKRRGIDEPILFNEESLGNRNLLKILPSFLDVVDNGGLLLIDEFSSGFHNELENLLIKYFNKESDNAQLIFVSHSTNLLSNSLLRPDQMYSVEFFDQEGSKVRRFSSEKPRTSQNIEKMYASGIFGGLPEYNEV